MQRGDLDRLLAFLAVAQERSFTRAAAKLGVSQSALSHTVRGLEERLGVRLLTRSRHFVPSADLGAKGRRLLKASCRGPGAPQPERALAALRDERRVGTGPPVRPHTRLGRERFCRSRREVTSNQLSFPAFFLAPPNSTGRRLSRTEPPTAMAFRTSARFLNI